MLRALDSMSVAFPSGKPVSTPDQVRGRLLPGHGLIYAATVVLVSILAAVQTRAETTLRVVMHSDLKILDPLFGPYITRNHGYLIYDTLFAADEKGEIKPQMVDRYDVSTDGRTFTFTLRDGLKWHDGKPVTSEDCIASIKRWAAKDVSGQMLMRFAEGFEVVDAATFRLKLREPTGLVLVALGKRSSFAPFMMPKRVAETDPGRQISDFTGSGPFVFKQDEWRPGEKTVYVKFDGYVPRPEPASGLAGGKVVKVDRVEWLAISDHQQAVNALLAGEIDLIESPPHDLFPLLEADPSIKLWVLNPLGSQFGFRPNHLSRPFDDPKIRRALWLAFNQEDFLKAVIGDPKYYKVCKAIFVCGTALESKKGMEGLLESNFAEARALLRDAGYDGTPIVLLHATDTYVMANLAPVAKQLMERAGFKVDMQSMDWQTLITRRAKKDPPGAGGWHAYVTTLATMDVSDPIVAPFLNSGCDKAFPGWPCDPEMEELRYRYAQENDPAKQKAIAEAIQVRATVWTPYIHLRQWHSASAARRNITGLLSPGLTVFWNVEKR
jgi:peptide/nickel transport system substrate-binding protein